MLYQWYYCLSCNCIILMFISLVLLLHLTGCKWAHRCTLWPNSCLHQPSLCSSLLFHRLSLSCHYSSYKSLWATCHDSSSTTATAGRSFVTCCISVKDVLFFCLWCFYFIFIYSYIYQAVDERNIPGMDRVDSLAEYLVGLRNETGQTLNSQQASTIIALWQNLLPYDQQRVAYSARRRSRLTTGRFRCSK